INTYLKLESIHIKQRLYNIFGLTPESNKTIFRLFELNMNCTETTYNQYFFSKKLDRTFVVGTVPWLVVTKAENSDCLYFTYLNEEWPESQKRLRLSNVIYSLLQDYAHAPSSDARMLTVERNSIYTFKTELSLSRSELIDKLLEVSGDKVKEIIYNESSRYPLAVRDSLRIANDLENIQKKTGEYRDYAERLERELLQGTIDVDKTTGAVEFIPLSASKSSKRLPIHIASSIVKTLSSLILYLKHLAKRDDLVIIDEPEMNMHPENQCILARIFAELVNKGLRMVISTHSDYIIREFNNLIMANELLARQNNIVSKAISKMYSKEEGLDKEKLEVLYFKPGKRNRVEVIPLPVYCDGFSIESIDNTITTQNEMSQNLYDLLHEPSND
ncbi:MAG: ATP-binding protein, partial [Muribaculaceae bacterium]|nr:ATP-binding protein [Muribaculaceae bacterium]